MKKDFGAKPWIVPQVVLIIGTYGEDGRADAMNAAWGGVGNDTQIFLCLSPGHKTVANLEKKKEFTVSIGTRAQMAACDYVGVISANDKPDKLSRTGWTVRRAGHVDAPVFDELPLTLECRLISYEPESCRLFGEIVNVAADESILTDGKVDMKKLGPIAFDQCNNAYLDASETVGEAFSVGFSLDK